MTLAECLQFADGSSFGPIAMADIKMPTSGETATSVSVQVIGAPGYTVLPPGVRARRRTMSAPSGPTASSGWVRSRRTAARAAPTRSISPPAGTTPAYHSEPGELCGRERHDRAAAAEPGLALPTDNNGVIVELPNPAAGGAATLSGGALVFGIGTQTNNALGSAAVLFIDDTTGFVQASFNGTAGLGAALDSGSNGNFINDNGIPGCTLAMGWYCPNSTLNLTATLTSAGGGTSVAANFSVANFESLFNANQGAAVMPNVAGPLSLPAGTPNPIQFDLGMPYFFGRNVFTAIENAPTPGGTGPYFAY